MSRTIVIAGSVAQKPHEAGHTWVFLQYLLGFRKLEFDVLLLDRLEPEMAFDAAGRPCAIERSVNVAYFTDVMRRFGLAGDFSLACDGGKKHIGLDRAAVLSRVRDAAMLINVMGFVTDAQILAAARRRVFLDIDPGFGQMWRELGLHDLFKGHDDFVTIGLNVGKRGCEVPTCGLDWITTPQPVVLDEWPVWNASLTPSPGTPGEGGGEGSSPRTGDAGRSENPSPIRQNPHPHLLPAYREKGPEGAFTTIASWRGPFGPIEYGGKTYGLRVHEFRRFIELPRLSGKHFDLALNIHPNETADLQRLKANHWHLIDPKSVAGDPEMYRQFICGSLAEFTVAKNLYVQTRGGWLSDRSICYLASGRPVLCQDTGLRDHFGGDAGLVLFETMDQAVAGAESIVQDYDRHRVAARSLAERHFDSNLVLGRLLATLGVDA